MTIVYTDIHVFLRDVNGLTGVIQVKKNEWKGTLQLKSVEGEITNFTSGIFTRPTFLVKCFCTHICIRK